MRRALLTLWVVLMLCGRADAVIYWTETFENPAMPGWSLFGNVIQVYPPVGVVTDRAFNGSRSFKINYPTPSAGGGAFNDRDFTTTDEIYVREFRNDNFFTENTTDGGGGRFVKLHLIASHQSLDDSKPDFWVDYDTTDSLTHQPYVASQLIYTPCGQSKISGTSPENNGLDGCNFNWNVNNFQQLPNKWYCWETHWKMNTPGQANGVIEMWGQNMTDGGPNTQVMSYQNLELRGPTRLPAGCGVVSQTDCNSPQKHFNFYRVFRQWGKTGDRWIDDVAVGDTRIGCGAAQPAMNTPANLLICRGTLCTPASVLPLPALMAAAWWVRRKLKRWCR